MAIHLNKKLERLVAPFLRVYRTRRITFTPRRLTWRLGNIAIDRPIFFLGVQGGGLTVLVKCFQRLEGTCFCMGNRQSWDAADNEMHVCVRDRQMPAVLSFIHNDIYPEGLPSDFYRYWTYATDRALDLFRVPVDKVDKTIKLNFRLVLKKILRAHAEDPNRCRLIDKSQLYTINIPLIESILDDTTPYFVLVARSPFGSVPRAARNYYLNPDKHAYSIPYEEALRLSAEHWNNSFKVALKDGAKARRFKVFRIEDFFTAPEAFLRAVCAFTELPFDEDMVPASGQPRTIYQQMGRRWWPLKRSNTDTVASGLSESEKRIVLDICGETMRELGYDVDV